MRTEERAYYDDVEQRYLFARCLAPYAALVASGMCRNARILDAGCGAGAGSALLADAGAATHAIDFSYPDVLLTHQQSTHVRAINGNVYRLPYRDDSFDVAVSCHVLEHLENPRQYLKELARVLVPSGHLWLITPNRVFSSPDGPPPNPYHVKEYFFDELVELMSDVFPSVDYRGVVHTARGAVARAEAARSEWHAVDPLGVRRFIPSRIKRVLRRLTGAVYPAELENVRIDDFSIQPVDPHHAVDLVAITSA